MRKLNRHETTFFFDGEVGEEWQSGPLQTSWTGPLKRGEEGGRGEGGGVAAEW